MHICINQSICACMPSHFSHIRLCDPMDCSIPGSSVYGIFQAGTLEWVAISSSRGSSQPRDRPCVSCVVGGFLTTEPPGRHHKLSGLRPWAWKVFSFPCPLHPVMLKFVALLHVPTVGVIIARGPAINLPQSEQEEFSDRVSCGRGDGLSRSPGSAWDVCSKGWGRGCWGHRRVSFSH